MVTKQWRRKLVTTCLFTRDKCKQSCCQRAANMCHFSPQGSDQVSHRLPVLSTSFPLSHQNVAPKHLWGKFDQFKKSMGSCLCHRFFFIYLFLLSTSQNFKLCQNLAFNKSKFWVLFYYRWVSSFSLLLHDNKEMIYLHGASWLAELFLLFVFKCQKQASILMWFQLEVVFIVLFLFTLTC